MSSASNNGGAGNIRYMAPERIDPASQNMRRTTACDVYGFACVCLFVSLPLRFRRSRCLRTKQLHTGRHPFHNYSSAFTISIQVVIGQRPIRPASEDCLYGMTDDKWQLIEDAWHQDPAARPSMLQLEERLRYIDTIGILGQPRSSRTSCLTFAPRELVGPSILEAIVSIHNPPTSTVRTQATLSHSLPDAALCRLPDVASTSTYVSIPSKHPAKKRATQAACFPCEHFTRPISSKVHISHYTSDQRGWFRYLYMPALV
jgi:hypothetical protein